MSNGKVVCSMRIVLFYSGPSMPEPKLIIWENWGSGLPKISQLLSHRHWTWRLSVSEVVLEAKSVHFQSFHSVFRPYSSNQQHGHQDVGGSSSKGTRRNLVVSASRSVFFLILAPRLTSLGGLSFVPWLWSRSSQTWLSVSTTSEALKRCSVSGPMPRPTESEISGHGPGKTVYFINLSMW